VRRLMLQFACSPNAAKIEVTATTTMGLLSFAR
jgi:hypothetical protein